MFGPRYFGRRFFGDRYWGDGPSGVDPDDTRDIPSAFHCLVEDD